METEFTSPPANKTELIRRIEGARAALEDYLGKLEPEALSRANVPGGWSILDHLIHLAEWRWKLMAMMAGRGGHEGLKIDAQIYQTVELDELNAILYERNRQRPAEEILLEFRRAHETVLAAIDRPDEADLQRAYDLTAPADTRRLLEGIIGNTYEHDLEHLAWIKEQTK
ncbi:MAG: ClbS/DfsB family four-helix bundle protein [Chloroflexi bacterium]|nr:MAG: ClbS/DfsB family four-helix bundle protein [Chloroflexota bacterium]